MVLGNPVWGKNFFDRKKERNLLKDTASQFRKGFRNNLAIIGLRKIGKTSLVKQFIHENKDRKEFFYIEVYMPEKNTEDFLHRCFREITRELITKINTGIETALTFETAIEIIQQKYPRTAFDLLKSISSIKSKKYEEGFKSLFKLLNTINKEMNIKIIFFLDEFQRILEYRNEIPSIVDNFRELIMNDENTLYIISGSAVGMLNNLISSSKSPLYGHFEKLSLRGFNFNDSINFINHKKDKNTLLNQNQQLFLYEITNGNPFYLDILINEFRKFTSRFEHQRIKATEYKKILVKQIFNPEGRIYSYFDSMIEQSLEKSGSKNYTKILISISNGNLRPSQISKDTVITLTTLPAYLKKLIQLELLTKKERCVGSRVAEYVYVDSLFEMWVKYIYGLKQDSFIKDIEDSLKIYSNNLSKVIDTFNSELGRGYESRIRELFGKFDDRVIDEETLPKFAKVDRLVIDADVEIDVFCEEKNEYWAVETSKGKIDVAKIKEFEEKLNIIKDKKIKRKIVIPIKNITQRAIERCKEKNFDIWSLEKVNRLMKEYGMFRILPL